MSFWPHLVSTGSQMEAGSSSGLALFNDMAMVMVLLYKACIVPLIFLYNLLPFGQIVLGALLCITTLIDHGRQIPTGERQLVSIIKATGCGLWL